MTRELKTRNREEEKLIYDSLMKLGLKLSEVSVKFDQEIFPWEPSEEDLNKDWFISGIFMRKKILDEDDGHLIKDEAYTLSLIREDGKRTLNGVSIINHTSRVQEVFPVLTKENELVKLGFAITLTEIK